MPKTIVIYSPDKDFRSNFAMVLQDFFNVVLTGDRENLAEYTDTQHADLLIADAVPSEQIIAQFKAIKVTHPALRIIILYVSQFGKQRSEKELQGAVDEVFYKPVDVGELIDSIYKAA